MLQTLQISLSYPAKVKILIDALNEQLLVDWSFKKKAAVYRVLNAVQLKVA